MKIIKLLMLCIIFNVFFAYSQFDLYSIKHTIEHGEVYSYLSYSFINRKGITKKSRIDGGKASPYRPQIDVYNCELIDNYIVKYNLFEAVFENKVPAVRAKLRNFGSKEIELPIPTIESMEVKARDFYAGQTNEISVNLKLSNGVVLNTTNEKRLWDYIKVISKKSNRKIQNGKEYTSLSNFNHSDTWVVMLNLDSIQLVKQLPIKYSYAVTKYLFDAGKSGNPGYSPGRVYYGSSCMPRQGIAGGVGATGGNGSNAKIVVSKHNEEVFKVVVKTTAITNTYYIDFKRGGKLVLSLNGGNGGTGGTGGTGEDGADENDKHDAISGGAGGMGGTGGRGGKGGNCVIYCDSSSMEIVDRIYVDVSGGEGGFGGKGGSGGSNGQPLKTSLLGLLFNGRGNDGIAGSNGIAGEPGKVEIVLSPQ